MLENLYSELNSNKIICNMVDHFGYVAFSIAVDLWNKFDSRTSNQMLQNKWGGKDLIVVVVVVVVVAVCPILVISTYARTVLICSVFTYNSKVIVGKGLQGDYSSSPCPRLRGVIYHRWRDDIFS